MTQIRLTSWVLVEALKCLESVTQLAPGAGVGLMVVGGWVMQPPGCPQESDLVSGCYGGLHDLQLMPVVKALQPPIFVHVVLAYVGRPV